MNWVWLSMPLAALTLAAVAGIPSWMVIEHPDTGPDAAAAKRAAGTVPAAGACSILAYERDDDVLADTAA
ncbi:MAG TPA: hypothetical protein VIJ82_12715 [Streptosporangiaceae bacterium]|jgi:hypothetical protein